MAAVDTARPGGAGDTEQPVADRRLTAQGVERKQQLLDHAARLFAERGYAETRVIDICRSAGVAKGLFYWYFENKEALFGELVTLTGHRLRVAQADAIDASANALVRIRQGVEASVRFNAEHRRLFSMWEMEGLDKTFADVVRRGTRTHAADTARHIGQGIDEGLIRDDDPLLLAYHVVGMIASLSVLHRSRQIEVPVDELAAFAGRFVVNALAADDAAAARALAAPPRRDAPAATDQ
jgi:AcrR family transcriptional regulator